MKPESSSQSRRVLLTAVSTAILVGTGTVHANGVYRNGVGAQSMGMAGADVAWAHDPFSALALNPAGLTALKRPEIGLGAFGGFAQGEFNKAGSGGDLSGEFKAVPEAAFALPLSDDKTVIGVSFTADSALSADWGYVDPAGGLDLGTGGPGSVSYGFQKHKAEITVLRTAFGAGFRVTPKLSIGADFGLVYNRNRLQSPYIFQSHPVLAGAKTLLDLRTDGFGWNATAGAIYQARTNLQFGVSYRSETTVHSTGSASGDVGAQLGAPSVPFTYDAQVNTAFPQQVSLGVSWEPIDPLRVAAQIDWIGWSGAFDTLPVSLANGSNPAINGFVGSTSLQDNISLNWRDRLVYRLGLEYALCKCAVVRAGYSFGESPIPSTTLTPMSAALMEHAITAGVGFTHGNWGIDLAYEYDLPAKRNVGVSGLRSGEYSNSSTEVSVHLFALSTRYRF